MAQDPVVVVGAVISQTGAHADLAQEYGRGLDLWRDEVNAAGGLLGRRVELRVLDDGSQALRAGPLYAQLITEEKVDLLVGPVWLRGYAGRRVGEPSARAALW